jgi:hypothetical protein
LAGRVTTYSPRAEAYGIGAAKALMLGKGGAVRSRRIITEPELVAAIALAFDAGAQSR